MRSQEKLRLATFAAIALFLVFLFVTATVIKISANQPPTASFVYTPDIPKRYDAIVFNASGSLAGNYITVSTYQIIFAQVNSVSDYSGTVLVVDGVNYNITDLPVSFWWDIGSVHSFSYQSSLLVLANSKRHIWTSTIGLSTMDFSPTARKHFALCWSLTISYC